MAEFGGYSTGCQRGETFARQFTWKDTAHSPVDLTGYTAVIELISSPVGSLTALRNYLPGFGVTLGGALGTVNWTIPPEETELFPLGRLVFNLRLTSSIGVVTDLVRGEIVMSPSVTP